MPARPGPGVGYIERGSGPAARGLELSESGVQESCARDDWNDRKRKRKRKRKRITPLRLRLRLL